MPKSFPSLLEYFLQDCLDGDKSFSVRKMFGGYGIYKSGKIFAIFAFDEIYFKVGENNLALFLEKNSRKFEYEKKGKKAYISYYTLPEEIMENKENLKIWIEKSLQIT